MPALERILTSDIISEIWKSIIYRIKDGKIVQLMTLKPIEVYDETMPYEIDGANLKVDVKAYLENLLQKPIQRAFDFLSMDFKNMDTEFLSYKINVKADVCMDYENLGIYLSHQFSNKQYWILDDRIGLLFSDFKLSRKNNQLEVIVPMRIDAKYKALHYDGHADVFARGNIVYDPASTIIKITDISYVATSDKFILRMVNLIYYNDIIEALEDFMQFDIREELNEGLELLRTEVKKYDEEIKLVSGRVDSLRLNRLELLPEGGKGYLELNGKIKLLS
ncbi:MAG TPA: DUF4403 family protein [Chitinophagales bacterium]|nr:DUF4403 family protein [Chitinophagales bacterium]